MRTRGELDALRVSVQSEVQAGERQSSGVPNGGRRLQQHAAASRSERRRRA